jgi:hypothetical protein
MKSVISNVLLGAVLTVCSCNKSTIDHRDATIPEILSGPPPLGGGPLGPAEIANLIFLSGDYHNDGLDHIIQQMNADRSLKNTTFIVNETNTYLSTSYGFDALTTAQLQENINSCDQMMANNAYLLGKERVDSLVNETVQQLLASPTITTREKTFLRNANGIFDLPAGISEGDAYDEIISRCNQAIAQYQAISWSPNEGEAIGPYLYIARSSAQYWKSVYLSGGSNNFALPGWIRAWDAPQFDAAGYIIGWGKAWLWDEETSAKKRIGAGIEKAVSWSGLKSLFS